MVLLTEDGAHIVAQNRRCCAESAMMSCAEREDDAEELVWRDDTLTLTLKRDQQLLVIARADGMAASCGFLWRVCGGVQC